jgi:hypothetical protein
MRSCFLFEKKSGCCCISVTFVNVPLVPVAIMCLFNLAEFGNEQQVLIQNFPGDTEFIQYNN